MLLPTALVLAAAAVLAGPPTTGAPAAGGGGFADILQSPLLFIGVMVVLMYFMLLRPQQQRQREHIKRVSSIKRGDTVVMSNGMLGKVVRVEEDELGVEIAQNVTVKMIKSMIHDVRVRGEPAPANDSKKS